MAEVIFTYNGTSTIIQCNRDDKMKDIIKCFLSINENWEK